MKNKELFERTVGILVKAYINNTLEHGNCCSCAVGNIVAANNGIRFMNGAFVQNVWEGDNYPLWGQVFMTDNTSNMQHIFPYLYRLETKKQIDSTGYSWQDLSKIELEFERAPKGNSNDDWMLNGLLAVYNVLCEIHEVEENEVDKGELVFVRGCQK